MCYTETHTAFYSSQRKRTTSNQGMRQPFSLCRCHISPIRSVSLLIVLGFRWATKHKKKRKKKQAAFQIKSVTQIYSPWEAGIFVFNKFICLRPLKFIPTWVHLKLHKKLSLLEILLCLTLALLHITEKMQEIRWLCSTLHCPAISATWTEGTSSGSEAK